MPIVEFVIRMLDYNKILLSLSNTISHQKVSNIYGFFVGDYDGSLGVFTEMAYLAQERGGNLYKC